MNRELRHITLSHLILALVFIIGLALSLVWNIENEYETVRMYAQIGAQTSLEQDLVYRKWAATHGGVYVPVSKHTQPNPYLQVPERDITTPSGKKLTLMNPAYMTRQVHELAHNQKGTFGHITSLRPIRPANQPDAWEAQALHRFEHGKKTYSSIETINNEEYLRYMTVLIAEKKCLKCHAIQGYKEGDVRGGLSVSVSMKSYAEIANTKIRHMLITYIAALLAVLALFIVSYRLFVKQYKKRKRAQDELIEREELLQTQNTEYLSLTEEYRAQNEQLIIAKQKAEESDRLKTAFLHNLSHEIRTPMNAICGFTKLMNQAGISADKKIYYANIIQSSSDRLLSVVSDVIAISTIETNQVQTNITVTNANDIIDELYVAIKPKATSKSIELKTSKALDDAKLLTDSLKVSHILLHLLSNALKFTDTGEVSFGYTIIGTEVQFFVSDTGIGISKQVEAQIFERFRQADESINTIYGGIGLGLAISKGYVEVLGGRIWFTSEVQKGTTFYFTIPYLPVRNRSELASNEVPTQNRITILVAEDEVFNSELINAYLRLDYNVLIAQDGVEAIEIFKSNPHIDIILMDIKMPRVDGIEAAKTIRSLHPKIPIIAQSAYAMEHEIAQFRVYFDDYIIKPIEKDSLLAKIKKFTT